MELWEMMHAYKFTITPRPPRLITEYKFSAYPSGAQERKLAFLSYMHKHSHLHKYIQTCKHKDGGAAAGKSQCIINCRADSEGGRRTTMITAAGSLPAQAASEARCTRHFISQYLQLIRPYLHISPVNESVAMSPANSV